MNQTQAKSNYLRRVLQSRQAIVEKIERDFSDSGVHIELTEAEKNKLMLQHVGWKDNPKKKIKPNWNHRFDAPPLPKTNKNSDLPRKLSEKASKRYVRAMERSIERKEISLEDEYVNDLWVALCFGDKLTTEQRKFLFELWNKDRGN